MVKYYSKKEIVEVLKEKAKELKRVPDVSDFDKAVAGNILSYFKKWDKALKAANLSKKLFVHEKTETPKTAVETKKCCKIQSEEPKAEEMKTAPVEKKQSACVKKYTKEMITEMLLAEYNRLGKKPTKKEIDENKELPSSSTCLKHFGTTRLGDMWKEILGE